MMDLQHIASITGGSVHGKGKGIVRQIATDSRSLPGTDGVLFVAIRGLHRDGHVFIEEVYNRGVRLFLCDQNPEPARFPDASFIVVKDSLEGLQAMAGEIRSRFKGRVIGITGSNGKTIVKEWLYQALRQREQLVRSPRSYNSQLGVPLSVWQLNDQFSTGIFEAGISMPGEMWKLETIIAPSIGILTNIGPAHGENFEGDRHKLKEKIELFKRCEQLVFRSEQVIEGRPLKELLEDLPTTLVDWSLSGEATYQYRIRERQTDAITVAIETNDQATELRLPVTDDASLENMLHVVTALSVCGYEMSDINEMIQRTEPVAMRLESLKGVNDSTIISDVYNTDLAGLRVALDVLQQQRQHSKKIVILSDLFQSGMDDRKLYRSVAELLAFRQVDRIIGIGKNISLQQEQFPRGAEFYLDTEEFLSRFDAASIEDSAVLVKGARAFHFEDIVRKLQLQQHQTVLEINLNELEENLNYFRRLLNPGTKIMIMVKALSYGAGSHEVAGFLQHQKVDYLAVAYPDEGIRLRNAGIHLPVMVMNSTAQDYRTLIQHHLEPEIFSMEGLVAFIKECRYAGLKGQPLHLKLDTGMHRLGFQESDIDILLEQLTSEEIQVKSLFSHLAASDDPTLDSFSRQQVKVFKEMAGRITTILLDKPLQHILNTSGIERFPEHQMDMVRVGIGLYGQGSRQKLANVSTFRTVVSQVRNVRKGETVGYGRKGGVDKDSMIATLPVGYADGIDRRLGNGNYSFAVKGRIAPTIGNICMDMTMVDVTGLNISPGDPVELFGKQCPVEVMAKTLDTIVYEVLTSIPERVKRVYVRE